MLLRGSLTLLLWGGLTLLLAWGGLTLLLLGSGLTLLLGGSLALLLLWGSLTLLLSLNRLVLLLLLNRLVLLLLLNRLMLLLELWRLVLLLGPLIVHLHRCRHSDVAVCRKRLVDDQTGWPGMVDAGKLGPVGAGKVLVLDLRPHGRSMLFMPGRQFRWSCPDLQAARTADETHACAPLAVIVHAALVDVVHDGDVHVVVGAVVVEMAASPITALVAEADVTKAVVDSAVEAYVRPPIATVKAVAAMPEAPVSGGPESALVRSLDPPAGHPVVACRRISPVAGGPEITVAGSWRLVVVGQGRRRLGSIGHRLNAVAGVIRALV